MLHNYDGVVYDKENDAYGGMVEWTIKITMNILLHSHISRDKIAKATEESWPFVMFLNLCQLKFITFDGVLAKVIMIQSFHCRTIIFILHNLCVSLS